MDPVIFPTNSTSLTPAFTPEMVSMKGMGVGPLGDYLNGCVMPPAAPCGGTVEIGMLGAMLKGESSSNMMSNSSGNNSSSSGTVSSTSPSTSPKAFTGEAGFVQGSGWAAVGISTLGALLASI
jgi:hypothetical protein